MVKCDPRHGKYMACCLLYRSTDDHEYDDHEDDVHDNNGDEDDGHEDDDVYMIMSVKVCCPNSGQANSHFVDSDIGRG